MTILGEILEAKRAEVAAAKARVSADEMAERASSTGFPARSLRAALIGAPTPAIIAELKRRSPSKGVIREDFDVVACAEAYVRGGAAALSVLTDERFFGGQLAFLPLLRQAVALPLLRKDFVVDAYQIDEARDAGADAVLLIAAALEPEALRSFRVHAASVGLEALVEVHSEAELELAVDAGADLIGVNHRDLHTFEVDLSATQRVAKLLEGRLLAPGGPLPAAGEGVVLVAESGISTYEDIKRLEKVGAAAFLVGESLMREPDLAAAVERLRGGQ